MIIQIHPHSRKRLCALPLTGSRHDRRHLPLTSRRNRNLRPPPGHWPIANGTLKGLNSHATLTKQRSLSVLTASLSLPFLIVSALSAIFSTTTAGLADEAYSRTTTSIPTKHSSNPVSGPPRNRSLSHLPLSASASTMLITPNYSSVE